MSSFSFRYLFQHLSMRKWENLIKYKINHKHVFQEHKSSGYTSACSMFEVQKSQRVQFFSKDKRVYESPAEPGFLFLPDERANQSPRFSHPFILPPSILPPSILPSLLETQWWAEAHGGWRGRGFHHGVRARVWSREHRAPRYVQAPPWLCVSWRWSTLCCVTLSKVQGSLSVFSLCSSFPPFPSVI